MKTFETDAICLRATPFHEADRIVTLYTAEYGELRAVAKGVKKPTAKLAGACELLTLNHVILAEGRGLHTVCHYARLASFTSLRTDLARMAAGAVCSDLIRLLGREHDPDSPLLYATLGRALHQLDDLDTPWANASLDFHREMLILAGCMPDFSHCVSCQEALELADASYYPFYPAQGGFLCPLCTRMSRDSNRVNVSTITMSLLLNPETPALSPRATVRAHRFLAYYWGFRLDRPVPSFEVLFQLLDVATPEAAEIPS